MATIQTSRASSSWARFRRWSRIEGLGAHIGLIVIMLFIFIPLFWLIGTTFKDRLEFSTHSALIIPTRFSLVNYEYMLTAIENLPIYMANSFILAFGVVIVQVFVSALAGYAFARMQFRFRDLIFVLILVSMFIPRVGGMFAEYELMTFLKLRNNIFGLVLLFASAVPVPIFIMRQTFQAIPKEIEESAMIDGASWLQVFLRIALPLAMGGVIIIGTLSFIGVWSDYLRTYIMIDRDTAMTISVGVRKVLATSYEAALSPRFRSLFAGEAADATMLFTAALPVILFYGILQRWFMKGLMGGAIKF